MPTTPLAASSRSACTQYGHWPVEYIVTTATSGLQRQPRAAPRGQAALQVVDVLEARLRERSARAAAALAARAVRDDRLARARGDLADALVQLGQRDVHGVRQLAAFHLLGLAHVEHERVAVHELRRH